MSPMPSVLFTAPGDWHWLVIFYFFVGGIAGGAYFLAALLDLRGYAVDRPLARLGYYVAFPATVVSGILLIVDLQRPLRFWHMLLQSETLQPMFKYWSPMSVGSWALLAFGAIAFLSFLAALADGGRAPRGFGILRPPGIVGGLLAVIGALLGLFVAGYTGVLLSVTNRPIWANTNFIGLLFLLSGASTGAATLVLLGQARTRLAQPGLHALERFDRWVLVLELLALVALTISLGSLARLWLNMWGVLLVVGVLLVGILIPLALYWRPRTLGGLSAPAAALLVLVGGFVLRVVIVFSSETV